MQLSEAEWKVMNCVWMRSPRSARDVLEELEDQTSWAYTTVKTMMTRLVEKGALSVRKRANTGLYEPRVTQTEARRSAVTNLLNRAFDGAFGPLLEFLTHDEKLSPKDRAALRRMLEGQSTREKR